MSSFPKDYVYDPVTRTVRWKTCGQCEIFEIYTLCLSDYGSEWVHTYTGTATSCSFNKEHGTYAIKGKCFDGNNWSDFSPEEAIFIDP